MCRWSERVINKRGVGVNLVDGKIISADECDAVLDTLNTRIIKTLSKEKLAPSLIIDACDALSRSLNETEHIQTLIDLGIPKQFAKEYIADAKNFLSREYIESRLKNELGTDYRSSLQYKPEFYENTVTEQIMPLGVLFHIAAGNTDGLPVFTVIEGLLTGNINILKLPQEEGGISVRILLELLRIQPLLTEYVYVFDYSSKDVEAMKKIAGLADAIVVWGGDVAIKAVREMATPNTKIIEWGHKISFAYVSGKQVSDEDLEGVAENISHTNQLLCSSCQGIYVNTDSMNEVYDFCNRFVKILDNVSKKYPTEPNLWIDAQISLRLYNQSIEAVFNDTKIFKGNDCSVTAYTDSSLCTSTMYKNCWVKRLPKNQVLATLRPYKNYLQTVGLVCNDTDAQQLINIFWKAGAVKITDGRHMSKMHSRSPHDGEYPLRRYTKTVSFEEKPIPHP